MVDDRRGGGEEAGWMKGRVEDRRVGRKDRWRIGGMEDMSGG